MSWFVQEIVLRLSDEKYLIEKTALPPLVKDKIDLSVAPGTVAIVGGTTYKGRETPYKLTREVVGLKRAATDAYLYPDKPFDGIAVTFFGGQHIVSVSSLPSAKAKFSIVGTASLEISDFRDLAAYFKRTITKEDLAGEINKNVRTHLSNEVSAAASKYITSETTEVTLRGALENIASDVMKSRKTASLLLNMGLILSPRGISMHLNALGDAENKMQRILDALTDKALESLDNDILDRAERELAAQRQHEIDLIRAAQTEIKEETKNINTTTNGNGKIVIQKPEKNESKAERERQFCPECGAKLTEKEGKFCPFCGKKLN